jgi:hypothetical protein
MHLPLVAALLLAAPDAGVAQATPVDAPSEAPRARLLGAQLHAGFPDGFAASAVIRPFPWLRANAGLAHNVLAFGFQGGVTLIPFEWKVAPTLHLAAGKFFDADVRDELSGDYPDAFDPALRNFGYTFYSAQLGLEFGSHRSFLFFLRGGVAWMRSDLDGVQGFQDSPGDPIVDVSDVRLRAAVPTASLGFIFYVW